MDLISVVVPVYGVEKYLDRCVESIVNQTYQNLEIILVDDGSKDRCPQMCDAWARKDSRIKVVHKENAGLGMARNTGIEHATGAYICFFDSDDYILHDTIEKTYHTACMHQVEVVVFGFQSIMANGQCRSKIIPQTTKVIYRNAEIMEYLLPNLISYDMETGADTRLNLSACMMLFSMSLVQRHNWQFVSERMILSEDIYSLLDLFGAVRSAAVLPEALYCYCDNQASLSRSYREDRYERARASYLAAVQLCRERGYPEKISSQLRGPFLNSTSAVWKQIISASLPAAKKYEMVRSVMEDSMLQTILASLNLTVESCARKMLFTMILEKQYRIAYALVAMKCHFGRMKDQIAHFTRRSEV